MKVHLQGFIYLILTVTRKREYAHKTFVSWSRIALKSDGSNAGEPVGFCTACVDHDFAVAS